MARKKGRPPKSPSPHPSPKTPNTTSIPKNLDLLNLDEDDMEDIEDLSPKKAGSILKKLDELRAKIKGKAIVEEDGCMNKDLVTMNTSTEGTSTQSPEIATEAVTEALKGKCVEEDEEVTVVKETQLERMDRNQEGQKENDQKEGQWTPVMTRRKGQSDPDEIEEDPSEGSYPAEYSDADVWEFAPEEVSAAASSDEDH
ncbi:hypothetical protein RIF29_04121 [Crotalaria pallida]|uniref:Uncharacterized protein n=1 Tax=Crotalaria pallida TaxID=3830 RepID=A0AAN9P9P1_CROPI